jgi:hypothetical protein
MMIGVTCFDLQPCCLIRTDRGNPSWKCPDFATSPHVKDVAKNFHDWLKHRSDLLQPHQDHFSDLTMKLEGRTYIISGGCSGLGLATARDLHAAGAYVSLLDLNAGAGEKIVKELGERSRFFEVDVSDTASVEQAVNGSVEWVKQTGKAIGGVVAAAGVGGAAKV